MAFQIRVFAVFCFLLCGICGFYYAQADPPKDLPLPDIEITRIPTPVPGSTEEVRDQAALQALRAAAEGKVSQERVSDPILGDVIQAIARRHRELDLELALPDDEVIGSGYVDPAANDPAANDRGRSAVSRNAMAAEQLLKASRLLENVAAGDGESDDPARAELVNRMRAEAVKLLSE
ncbi:MAG: hypothetical protein OSA98_05710 [Rubripirellula sp.]|nr:hypothetical protein [Rubripirellula sp.]